MSVRNKRIADEIQKSLALLLQTELKDPRVGFVTISGVDVTKDLSYANVYVTWMHAHNSQDVEPQLEALRKAAGFLRSRLSKQLTTRITPHLKFKFDSSFVTGQKMDMLFAELSNCLLYTSPSPRD